MKIRSVVLAGALAAGGLAACGPARGPLNCTVALSMPGMHGLPLSRGAWWPMFLNEWDFSDWYGNCMGKWKIIKFEPPSPTPTSGRIYHINLDPRGCFYDVEPMTLHAWQGAIFDPNYASTNAST